MISKEILSPVSIELIILTKLTLSNKLRLNQIHFHFFLMSKNLHSFLSIMHFISIYLIFLKLNEDLLTFIFVLEILICSPPVDLYQQQFEAVHMQIYKYINISQHNDSPYRTHKTCPFTLSFTHTKCVPLL